MKGQFQLTYFAKNKKNKIQDVNFKNLTVLAKPELAAFRKDDSRNRESYVGVALASGGLTLELSGLLRIARINPQHRARVASRDF